MKFRATFLSALCGLLLFTGCSGGFGLPVVPDDPADPENPEPLIALSLDTPRPESGSPVTAVFTVNGGPASAEFRWARSADGAAWEDLPGKTAAAFLPWTEDVGRYLQVKAAYQGQVWQAETIAPVTDSLAALIASGLSLNLMPGDITGGTDAALDLPVRDGVSYLVAILPGDSSGPPGEGYYTAAGGAFLLSAALAGPLTTDAFYTVYIKAERNDGLTITAPHVCEVRPRRAFSTFSTGGEKLNGGDITEPYGNPQYRGGNSITVGDTVYAVTEEQYARLDAWCRNNPQEKRSIYNLSVTNGIFAEDVELSGFVDFIYLYGFNAEGQTRFTPNDFTAGSLYVEDGAALILPADLGGKLTFTGNAHIRAGGGGELRNMAGGGASPGSPWTAGLEDVQWTFRWGSTVYTSDYTAGARAFITKNGSGIESTAVWETGSASNESSLTLIPAIPGVRRALVTIDGKTTFIHAFTAYSDWDIKEGSKITVAMQNSAERFDFSNEVAPEETDPAETAKRFRLIGHTGPLPIANSYFRVDRGHLIALPGIADGVWDGATSFRWSSGRWIAE
jgi:hypothetical protein